MTSLKWFYFIEKDRWEHSIHHRF